MKGLGNASTTSARAPMAMTHHTVGVVKKEGPEKGLVAIAHEPVQSVIWPAMSMGLQVKDKMLLNKLKVGQKVEFDF